MEEALHVYDAINRPSRTFPSFVGKSPPTRLTRYMGPLDNNALARDVHRRLGAELRQALGGACR